ncbi:TRASH domain-containing protein [Thermogymnomonas acidicola]|uniref:TRASH domain-containing protein n=1 Tax=Thermogymnomonas acidicola TaxID=399579 RepID=UPI0009463513|nr:TRASH domain-containing protein [Thermogymnomonas acidicola]
MITDMDEGDMVLLRTRDPESVPDSCVVERLDLLGEESLVLIRPECLRELSGQGHLAIEYVKKRYVYSFSPVRGVKCDYCGKFIDGKPIEVEFMGRTLYACCTNCERDLRRRVEGVEVR